MFQEEFGKISPSVLSKDFEKSLYSSKMLLKKVDTVYVKVGRFINEIYKIKICHGSLKK